MHGISSSAEDCVHQQKDVFLFPTFACCSGMLLPYFGEHVKHADFILKSGHDCMQKSLVGSSNIPFDTFIKGLSCFAAAQETGLSKYRKLGMILLTKIKKWLDMGQPQREALLRSPECRMLGLERETACCYEGVRISYSIPQRISTCRCG